MLYIDWDPRKAAANLLKHGIDFKVAQQVFADENAISEKDRVESGEVRWRTTGAVDGLTLVVVAHTWQEDDGDEYVRLISARPTERHEIRTYDRSRFGLA